MSKEIKTGKDYLQKKYPEMKGDKWNTHEVINDNWIAEQMDEYVEYRLKAQEEKNKEEMEKFAEWIVGNRWIKSVTPNFFIRIENRDDVAERAPTTELIEMFKNQNQKP